MNDQQHQNEAACGGSALTAELGCEITVGREMMCRDAERHADALRYVDGLMVECIELSLRNMPGNEVDGPLHWRLRRGREKLRAAVESLERGYLVEVPNASGLNE